MLSFKQSVVINFTTREFLIGLNMSTSLLICQETILKKISKLFVSFSDS